MPAALKYVLRFTGLWIVLTFLFSVINTSFEQAQVLIQGINSLLFTTGYFFAYRYLIRPYLYKGKTRKFILLYLLIIIFLSAVSFVAVYEIYVIEGKKFYVENYWKEPVFFSSSFILMLLVTSSLLSFRFLNDRMQTQLKFENLEKEKISTELDFLKAQINPHFLFNSLNNILFKIDRSNTDARETLLKFSEMLRYQLYECTAEKIEIERELQYIKNYIEIQMMRKSEKYHCSFSVSGSVKNFRIAPLLLIPFIENAFKHVSNHTSRKNSIDIAMDYKEGTFLFTSVNDKDNTATLNISEKGGIGLANVKRRLDLLYMQKHELLISEADGSFRVNLKMEVENEKT